MKLHPAHQVVAKFQVLSALVSAGLAIACALVAPPVIAQVASPCQTSQTGSPFVPMDNWIYPALDRLHSLGYLDSAYLGLRPWTRLSIEHMLEETAPKLEDANPGPVTDEAQSIYDRVSEELNEDVSGPCKSHGAALHEESAFTVARGVSGTPLHDSFHLGQSMVNDYGRPIEEGFNNYSGASGYATAGIFTLYARGEFQYAPSGTGYSTALFDRLSGIDNVPFATNPIQETIPGATIGTATNGRLVEGYLSAHLIGHEISFGKMDEWWGPGRGGAYAFSTNAENFYSFQINRVEPLWVPGLSRITGPFRYQFLVGSLKGHTDFRDPWVHAEKISLKPTHNLEVGFERTVIWGGEGHVPITLHSFLKSFFSLQNVTSSVKFSRNDPGARFGAFDVNYRLPWLRNWLTFVLDSEAHDDVSPVSAPRRAMFRTGLSLSHVPGLPKLSLRGEAIMDDPSTSVSDGGRFQYYEAEVPQGYTNAGQIFGDWMGREGKGGQAWATWHLSPNEWIEANWRSQKVAKDFAPGGTTLGEGGVQVVKRFGHDLELNGNFTLEKYLVPVYKIGRQTLSLTTVQLTWFPGRKVNF